MRAVRFEVSNFICDVYCTTTNGSYRVPQLFNVIKLHFLPSLEEFEMGHMNEKLHALYFNDYVGIVNYGEYAGVSILNPTSSSS